MFPPIIIFPRSSGMAIKSVEIIGPIKASMARRHCQLGSITLYEVICRK